MQTQVGKWPEENSPLAPSDLDEEDELAYQIEEVAHQIEEAMEDIRLSVAQASQADEEGAVGNTAFPLRDTHMEEEYNVGGNTLTNTMSRGLIHHGENTPLDNQNHDDVINLGHG